MENSLDETEPHQSLSSPPKRRRSTFFDRRDSVVPQPPDDVNTDVCQNYIETEKRHSLMSKYFEKLLTEKEQWKKETKERRNKYHDLRLQYQMATNTPSSSRLSYAALTKEDIEFLNSKPNISKLIESQQKLHNITKINVEFVRRLNELEDVALELCEKRVDKITAHILEHSTIGPSTS